MLIKAIPTTYGGTRFRSRLEARWAAFFDLCGWTWDYEPLDLEGWCPDFVIRTPLCPVFVEVKPAEPDGEMARLPEFAKAVAHWRDVQVLLLGMAPRGLPDYPVGALAGPPAAAAYSWAELAPLLTVRRPVALWRRAGNSVQWRKPKKLQRVNGHRVSSEGLLS
ncbi:MAG TPA: hypothetical protein VHL98_10985 [Microvirga sp.]|jgi:hypothetical protein|nr:hypothetical protein [Microvirga sp.]